uniref:Uncharacterized protein n=1 Tax=Pyramimonas obovata TaxID=1411642 RepID=A0A7S0MWH3_9CHLO|mmetsp:Transcript_12538/g.26434  ORF Transcript_12538/g.26434 Transcript_12538/m.26434 type:complete len:174 (+) Transcript_12538:152-673(+)
MSENTVLYLVTALAPDKAGKWQTWAEQLAAEDIDTEADLLQLDTVYFESLRISAYLKQLLHEHREALAGTPVAADGSASSLLPQKAQTGYFKRLWTLMATLLEFLIPIDHWPWFKSHWIDSLNDEDRLKDGIISMLSMLGMMLEMELILGSFLFSSVAGIFFPPGSRGKEKSD